MTLATPYEADAATFQPSDIRGSCVDSTQASGSSSTVYQWLSSCTVTVIADDGTSKEAIVTGQAGYETISGDGAEYLRMDGGGYVLTPVCIPSTTITWHQYQSGGTVANMQNFATNPGRCLVLGLKNKPPQKAGTVVTQSPTAGAPVSDLTIPALAVGAGLAAVGFGLSRRRRA